MPPTPDPSRLILLADDDPNDLFFLRRRLDKIGVKNPIVTFVDGAQVVDFLRASCVGEKEKNVQVGLLFLDVRMPRMGGFDVLRWIRQQPRLRTLEVVILSGGAEPSDLQRAAEFGVRHYLRKFPEPEIFANIIAEANAGG